MIHNGKLEFANAKFLRQDAVTRDAPVIYTQTIRSLSVIVPTRNEAGNIQPLLEQIRLATAGVNVEVIFVDDSQDNTPQLIEQASQQYPFPIKLIARPPERHNGLGMAVVEGMRLAKSEWMCVMDGDLQHPPMMIPQLLAKASQTQADVVIGSRLAEGGSTAGLGVRRTVISHCLALFSRLIFFNQLGQISDPLTGFFVVRRSALDLDQLRPEGFKILLEILVRFPALRAFELPFTFGKRHAGDSKACVAEMLHLGRHMTQLRLQKQLPLLRFLTVGASGILLNTMLLALFTELWGLFYLLSALFATQGSTLWNFYWTEAWVFDKRERPESHLWQRLVGFMAMNNVLLLLRGPMLAIFVSWWGVNYLLANVLTLVLMTTLRFAVADRLIWGKKKVAQTAKGYHYNIHNIIRVRSMQRLPELSYFQTDEAVDAPDIDVRVVGNVMAHRQPDSIVYEEILGRLGFNLVINRYEARTEVFVSRLIGWSPHVLYTNVVEPLLRWLFVRKGYALMHGACVSFQGEAVFVTAQTDTGKTTTILHTLQNNTQNASFLSDDMTIFSQDGEVINYPKPLTISAHTLQAVGAAPLRKRERLWLAVQSRLHSRGGRRVGMLLNTGFIPTATLNALVQMLIPPPKFMVHRLIPGVQYVNRAHLAHIALIERGADFEGWLADEEKAPLLVANAEDAYGFPPYPVLAHLLSGWEGVDLHEAERKIVQTAVKGLPAIHLRSPRYDWYKRLPNLVKGNIPRPLTPAPASAD